MERPKGVPQPLRTGDKPFVTVKLSRKGRDMHDHMTIPTRHQPPNQPPHQPLPRPQAMTCPKGCASVDPDLIDRLQAMVTHRTDAALTERFGISYNTWRKLIAGQPVRASVLSRLEVRVAMLEALG